MVEDVIMSMITGCCEDFDSLVDAQYIYKFNNKPTMNLKIWDDIETIEVQFTHCPFCGKEVTE